LKTVHEDYDSEVFTRITVLQSGMHYKFCVHHGGINLY